MQKSGKTFITLLIAISLSFLAFLPSSSTSYASSQTFHATALWGSQSSPVIASPGQAALPLSVSVFNLGPSSVSNLTVTMLTKYPLQSITGQQQNISQYIPLLPAGSSAVLFGYFNIFSNATTGLYNETLQLKYLIGAQSFIQNLNVSVAILGPPKPPQGLQVIALWGSQQNPVPVSPGSSNLPLLITIYNLGPDNLYNFSAKYSVSYPLLALQGEAQVQSTLAPVLRVGESANILGYYSVEPSSQQGMYNSSLQVSYSNGSKEFSQSIPFQIPILGYPSIHLSSFFFIPSVIYPGYPSAQLQVVLVNTGNSVANDVNLTLSTSYPVQPFYPEANVRYVGLLPIGQPVNVLFPLAIANTSSTSNATLTLHVHYSSGDQIYSIPFTEKPKAVLQVVKVETQRLSAGDGADFVTLTIRNIGISTAQGTSIALLPSNVFQPSIPSTASPLLAPTYLNTSVGDIPPGGEVNVTYVISVNQNIPAGTYRLSFIATWMQSGASLPFEQQIPVYLHVGQTFTQSLGQNLSNPILLLIIVFLIILIVVGVAVIARGRRRIKR